LTASSPTDAVSPNRSLRRSRASWIVVLLVVGVALLMNPLPGLGATAFAAPVHLTSTPAPVAPTTPSHPPAPTAADAPALAGTGPNTPAPGLNDSQIFRYAAADIAAGAPNASAGATPSASSPPAVSSSNPSPAAAPFVYIPTGTFNAYVYNASSDQPISGVSAQAFPLGGGSFCPPLTVCTAQSTGTNGEVNLTCPAGPSFVTFTKSFFAENISYATCDLNTTTDLGIVDLDQDGVVIGTVEGDVNGTPGLGAVQVTGEARDFSLVALPGVVTAGDGAFRVPVPPDVAGRIDFVPAGVGYQNNFTWVTVAPGQTINIGTVFLEPNSLVKARFYDSVTGAAIDTVESLTVCSSVSGTCGLQGTVPEDGGNTVEAVGAPGYDFIEAEAAGYVENESPIGYVPGTAPGHPWCVPDDCKVYLTFIGAVEVTTDVSGTPSPKYGLGLYVSDVCNLDGFELAVPKLNPVTGTFNTTLTDCVTNCGSPGGPLITDALPMRNDIRVFPDTTAICNGIFPEWPIPSDLPVWANETAANVTPYEITQVGYLNLTPGSYIEGNIYTTGTDQGPTGGFSVEISSVISNTPATYGYELGESVDVCPESGPTVFCAAAPPGPDKLVVSGLDEPDNTTWLSVPWTCCSEQDGPLTLGSVTDPSIQSLNLTPNPSVNSTVVIQGGSEPLPFASATVCPASPTSAAPCGEGLADRTGGLTIGDVPFGWDVLHASASGYAPNSEWIYVAHNMTAPTLPLTPLATLEGYVVSSNGSAIIDASIGVCTLASGVSSRTCHGTIGSGTTTSAGYYQGLVDGGWLPGATYEVQASAPGFEADWTWANATSNQTTVVPTLVLQPVGHAVEPGVDHAVRAPTITNPAGTWVQARIVDNSTLLGVSTQAITACAVQSGVSGACTSVSEPSNTGGFLNTSLPTGTYNLSVSPTGYLPITILLTVPSGVPTTNAGTILVDPLNWVFGRIQTNWTTIEVNDSNLHKSVYIELSPPADAFACGLYCGSSTPDATSGAFQTQTSPGLTDVLIVNPSYPGSFTSAAGGFNPTRYTFMDEVPLLNLTVNPVLVIYAAVSGMIYNAASCPPLGAESYCTDSATWATVQVSTNGVNNGVATATVNPGGHYITFIPGDNDQGATKVTAFDASFFFTKEEILNAQIGAYPGWNLTFVAPPLELTQFGFAYATVVDSVTGLPVVGVGLSSQFNDLTNGNAGTTTGTTNGAGFVNITAPSGHDVQFSVGGSNDYNNSTVIASVPIGNATNLDLNFTVEGGPVTIPAWGWVQSTYVDYSAPIGYPGTVVDRANGLPLPGASVSVSNPDPLIASGGSSQTTNALGEYLGVAPLGPKDTLTISLPAYETNTTTPLNITPDLYYTSSTITLTGYGVLASHVISEPTGLPVADATVTACEGTTNTGGVGASCVATSTNATGAYWIDVAPGHISIVVNATGFVSNYTEVVAATTDTWTPIAPFELVQDGTLYGTVRGLPTGLAVGGALVAACSPLGGVPTGPCSFSINALANGTFSLPVEPSQYILATSSPGFNASYLPISVQPGETVDLGIILLDEYGILTGTVLDGVTGAPVAGAVVGGCPVDALLPCDIPTVTNQTGVYSLASPPGMVNLVVSANGFINGYAGATAESGLTVPLGAILIAPIVNESTLRVSGTVVQSNDSSLPIAGATVGLWVDAALTGSTSTGPGGTFSLSVPTGTYTLEVTAAGYSPVDQALTVDEDVSGLIVALTEFGWVVSGTVEDGLTHAPLANVAIWSSAALLGESSAAGVYSLSLPNGTYSLSADAGGASAAIYAPVPFEVQVGAAAVLDRNVLLYPGAATVAGQVLSASNDTPIAGAQVTVTGTASDGAPLSLPAATDGSGRFSVAAYVGTYHVTVAAPGYHAASVTVVAGVATPAITVSLTSLTGTPSSNVMASWGYALVGLVLIGAVVVVVAVLARRKGATP
jgi:Carboxypeptidase regulatory-like domain